jgi:hypothetical protein
MSKGPMKRLAIWIVAFAFLVTLALVGAALGSIRLPTRAPSGSCVSRTSS